MLFHDMKKYNEHFVIIWNREKLVASLTIDTIWTFAAYFTIRLRINEKIFKKSKKKKTSEATR